MPKKTCQECKKYTQIARYSLICSDCQNKLYKASLKPKQAYREDTIKVGKYQPKIKTKMEEIKNQEVATPEVEPEIPVEEPTEEVEEETKEEEATE